MLKEMKRQITINRSTALTGLAVAAGIGVLCSLIMIIIILSAGASGAFPQMGGIAFSVGAAFFTLIMAIGGVSAQFNMALKMGAVRRQYLLTWALLCFVYCFAMMLLGNLWGLLDRVILQSAGVEPVSFMFSIPLAAFISLAVTVFGCWAGSFIMRYSRKGFWFMWAIWMLASLGGSQVMSALSSSRTDIFARGVQAVARFLGGFSVSGLWILGLVVIVAMAAHTWGMLHRVQAND